MPPPQLDRPRIISAITTPLAFFALGLLIAEVVFAGALPFVDQTTRKVMVYAMIGLIFSLVGIVAYMMIQDTKKLRYSATGGIIHTGDTVVLLNSSGKPVISDVGAVEWDKTMQTYGGLITSVTKVNLGEEVCWVEADGGQFAWHFSWVAKIRDTK